MKHRKNTIIGAIAGDIIGSRFEWRNHRSKKFELLHERCFFTDDSVCTLAVAESLLENKDLILTMKEICRKYPNSGYGGGFTKWLNSNSSVPYHSYGNGSAMRVSAVGFFAKTEEATLALARESAEITHNHKEGIKGAEATALAIFWARNGMSKAFIKEGISLRFGYDLDRSVDELRKTNKFYLSCQKTVPEAMVCFLESNDYEDAIRNAVSIGGDTDTIACITGGISAAYYGEISEDIRNFVMRKLPQDLREILIKFEEKI